MAELMEASKPYTALEEWFAHIEEYTEALKQRQSRRDTEGDGVRLMTMHAAKGLEFNSVFIIEANEGQIPFKRALREQKIQEERRLFYVAMTRAKELLKIVYVKTKNGKEISPSRFVGELLETI